MFMTGVFVLEDSVAIVVPVFNERESVPEFYERVKRIGLASGLIWVDNASTDGTTDEIARNPNARIIRHERNLGYGASIRDGLAASGRAQKIVIIDADLEYPPESIPELVVALDRHAVVYGSRFLPPLKPAMSHLRRVGNRMVSGLFNILYGQKTTDFYTGLKALRREAVDALSLTQGGFEHVVEMGSQLARAGIRIHEVPVPYAPRIRGVSKMRHIPETIKYLWFLVKYRFGPNAHRERRPAQ
jgi:glycosyltransferase involved in cell wall biosynthesis